MPDAELTAARAENARLREALKPFAEMVDMVEVEELIGEGLGEWDFTLPLAWFAHARAVLKEKPCT